MFNVGDLVRAKQDSGYWVTNNNFVCKVLEIINEEKMKVCIYENGICGDLVFVVYQNRFNIESQNKKMEEEKIMIPVNNERRNEIEAALNLEEMMSNGYDILNSCEIYNPTDYGMKAIEKQWLNSKLYTSVCDNMSIFEILSKHPNYIPEKGYIAFSNDWNRPVDVKVIREVIMGIYDELYNVIDEVKICGYRYLEAKRIYENMENVLNCVRDIKYITKYPIIDNDSFNIFEEDYYRFKNIYNKFYHGDYKKVNGICCLPEDYSIYMKLRELFSNIDAWVISNKETFEKECLIDEQLFNMISEFKEIKGIRVGQKLNKVIGKILKTYGMDSHESYNSWLARLGDACSPIQFTRHTIISLNRNDYWTMSWGTDWCSCANIDKRHKRHSSKVGMYGDGCCSSGTESYMLDPSTVVMYTVDGSYDGKDFELQDKINRCLFHVGERKFIMGRVYPQGTDGEDAVYKQWRETFQKVIADCLGATNYWKTTNDHKYEQYESYGTHYRDYEMDYCDPAKWCYLKENADTEPSDRRIIIGHDPICPQCGSEHDIEENIQCCDYGHKCAECGDWHEEDDMYLIDGEWYCGDCVSYCDYHQEYEHEELTYVEGYGYVCDDAIDYSGDFSTCDNCGEIFYSGGSDGEFIEDRAYCSEGCAEEDGWNYCTECGTWVSDENWNEEEGICNSCAAERSDD